MSRHLLPIKEQFTIQDLENLSGIKAHTIRIWEKRYNLLTPARTANNVRTYDSADLKKILNVSTLIQYGYRISAIAALSDQELRNQVNVEASGHHPQPQALSDLKMAMMTFDQRAFDQTCQDLGRRYSFREIYGSIFLPLLHDIGVMWQTGTIHIGHEHFVSNLIKQKILLQIEQLSSRPVADRNRTFILFLPVNEVHELGLIYTHYELLAAGEMSIYLGASVPTDVLQAMLTHYPRIHFITWLTVEPHDDNLLPYLENMAGLLRARHDHLWVLGRKTEGLTLPADIKGVSLLNSPTELMAHFA